MSALGGLRYVSLGWAHCQRLRCKQPFDFVFSSARVGHGFSAQARPPQTWHFLIRLEWTNGAAGQGKHALLIVARYWPDCAPRKMTARVQAIRADGHVPL